MRSTVGHKNTGEGGAGTAHRMAALERYTQEVKKQKISVGGEAVLQEQGQARRERRNVGSARARCRRTAERLLEGKGKWHCAEGRGCPAQDNWRAFSGFRNKRHTCPRRGRCPTNNVKECGDSEVIQRQGRANRVCASN